MNTIIQNLGSLYHPIKAFVVFAQKSDNAKCYVEAYDMDSKGKPINAHPLGIAESAALATALDVSGELKRSFLKPKGLLPDNVIYINPEQNGYAIWHTPMLQTELHFVDGLNIPKGKAFVPTLLWKATRKELQVYALNYDDTPTESTPLFNAPFFNLYKDGKVCMGTVSIKISDNCLLEEFMDKWQDYFFNSYFSHLINDHNPIKGNLVALWQSLINTNKKFPSKRLLQTKLTIKNLLK